MALPLEDKQKIIADVKTLTNAGDSKDELLGVLVDRAENTFYHYTNWSTVRLDARGMPLKDEDGEYIYYVPKDMYVAITELVVYYYNTLAIEGFSQYKVGQITMAKDADIPTPIKRKFQTYKRMLFF